MITMKILIFITGFRQVKEYDYFSRFLRRLNILNNTCDIFIYCNNSSISNDIVTYYQSFSQKNKHLYITSLNIGFSMGGVEAISSGIEMGIFSDCDYVIHLHPDVFIVSESKIVEILNDNADNDYVFFVNKSEPDNDPAFSFDFFIFKPKLLRRNIFIDKLYSYQDTPERYLYDVITENNIKFKLVKRFATDYWFPRRIDENLNLYHEHDLGLVEALLENLPKSDGCSRGEAVRWESPIVDLHGVVDKSN